MRFCAICQNAFRTNDPGGTCTVAEGNIHGHVPGHYAACSECCAIYDPEGPFSFYVASLSPARTRIASGVLEHVPAGLCGVCGLSAREDDTMQAMRLYPADAPDRPDLFPNGICSHFHEGSCSRCDWQGVFEDRCPKCMWSWRRDQLDGEPGRSVRKCDWHGPYVPECPQCGDATIQREECYLACGECRRQYAPVILERLKAAGLAAPHMRPEHMGAFMFA